VLVTVVMVMVIVIGVSNVEMDGKNVPRFDSSIRRQIMHYTLIVIKVFQQVANKKSLDLEHVMVMISGRLNHINCCMGMLLCEL
jgi:hypothetical protein